MTDSVDPYRRLSPRAGKRGLVNVIIDTPRGSANKDKYDEQLGLFKISRVLPAGMHQHEHVERVAVLGAGALIGGFHVEQFERRRTVRNDRLIAVPQTEVNKPEIHSLRRLGRSRLHEIEEFFVSYNRVQGRSLRVVSRFDARRAQALLRAAIEAHRGTT